MSVKIAAFQAKNSRGNWVKSMSGIAVLITKNAQDDDPIITDFIREFEMIFDCHDPPECSVGNRHARSRIANELIDRAANVGQDIAERFGSDRFIIFNNCRRSASASWRKRTVIMR